MFRLGCGCLTTISMVVGFLLLCWLAGIALMIFSPNY